MGQYLAIGLRLKATVRKVKQLDGKSVEEILGKVEDKYNLSKIYERREEETYLSRRKFLIKNLCR